jgi:hypothetical protein
VGDFCGLVRKVNVVGMSVHRILHDRGSPGIKVHRRRMLHDKRQGSSKLDSVGFGTVIRSGAAIVAIRRRIVVVCRAAILERNGSTRSGAFSGPNSPNPLDGVAKPDRPSVVKTSTEMTIRERMR